jgi:diadenosine tetraphosphate (Ap4A) HIT family hydrolase
LIENSPKPGCLFCQIARREREAKILEVFPHCYAIKDEFPVSKGHILIIPNEHTENWFTAREEVRLDMIKALHLLKKRLDAEYNPHGYNIGMNCGEAAGQTVMHLHLHLIPRYWGDMENPKGGVRGVIPSKQKYSLQQA